MLYADIFILEFLRDFLCSHQKLRKSSGRIHIVRVAGYLRQLFQFLLNISNHCGRVHIHVLEQLRDQSVLLHQKRHVQMFPIQHLMSLGNRDILTVHNSLLRVLRIFFNVHIITPVSSKHKHFYPISFIFSDSDMLSIPSQLYIYPFYTHSNAM